MINKRAQGMSTQTVILLILGLIILVVLIVGFSTGWKGFKKILASSNVDSIVEDCATSCSLQNTYDFCSGERTLRAAEDDLEVSTSCYVLANSDKFDKYKVDSCSQIDCDLSCDDLMIDGKKGDSTLSEGIYDLSSLDNNPEGNCFIN